MKGREVNSHLEQRNRACIRLLKQCRGLDSWKLKGLSWINFNCYRNDFEQYKEFQPSDMSKRRYADNKMCKKIMKLMICICSEFYVEKTFWLRLQECWEASWEAESPSGGHGQKYVTRVSLSKGNWNKSNERKIHFHILTRMCANCIFG